jgi:hypothetical protein
MHSTVPRTRFSEVIDLAQEFRLRPPFTTSDTALDFIGRPILVPGIERPIKCKLATRPAEWEAAFRLVAANYRERGYEPVHSPPLRFTPYHALPDTVTLVAQAESDVVATLSLVFDNCFLGLPMEVVFGEEINGLRRQGRRLVEVTSLADAGLSVREFMAVFRTLMRLLTQYGLGNGAGTFVISINPRHRAFYRKVMGFVLFGPCRAYPSVQNHPAEAYLLEKPILKAHSPEIYEEIVEQTLPIGALIAPPMPSGLIDYFASLSKQADRRRIHDVLVLAEAGEFLRRPAVR